MKGGRSLLSPRCLSTWRSFSSVRAKALSPFVSTCGQPGEGRTSLVPFAAHRRAIRWAQFSTDTGQAPPELVEEGIRDEELFADDLAEALQRKKIMRADENGVSEDELGAFYRHAHSAHGAKKMIQRDLDVLESCDDGKVSPFLLHLVFLKFNAHRLRQGVLPKHVRQSRGQYVGSGQYERMPGHEDLYRRAFVLLDKVGPASSKAGKGSDLYMKKLTLLLHSLILMGEDELAMKLFTEKMSTEAMGIAPDVVVYSSMLNMLVARGASPSEVMAMFASMLERGVTPSVVTVAILLKSCEVTGDADFAFRL